MLRDRPYPSIGRGEKLVLFVVGGSLGASVFSEVVPAALVRLAPELKARLSVTQQCRAEDMDAVRAAYEQAGINARLESFFDDVPGILGSMHLAICRSGASTVAEVTTAGRPAIFVPYPHHGDVQQKRNAESVVAAGGAWLFDQKDFTPDTLYELLEKLLNDPAALQNAAAASRSCGHPDATARLADAVMAL
jgi:UDP-N-acetylglucosamine--N-acetylmuramyl-(pentapeptide) pyrophosphoryl-undecaprenol N-acetylglucosamine transferase